MTEERISLLFKLSTMHKDRSSTTYNKMKSYYLMRCHSLTRESNLPNKQFSNSQRCGHCCSEWRPGSYTSIIKPVKLTKNQRRKIKQSESKKHLLHCTQLERLCLLCNKTTVVNAVKLQKEKKQSSLNDVSRHKQMTPENTAKSLVPQLKCREPPKVNVYTNSKDVFALDNKNNTLQTAVKGIQKPIKNNKKKKDKFAGLCKAAVLASAKINKEKTHKSKLDLFLRKSS